MIRWKIFVLCREKNKSENKGLNGKSVLMDVGQWYELKVVPLDEVS